jgi:hypothetical protein
MGTASLGTIFVGLFPGLSLTRDWVIPRIVSLFLPLLLLPVAAAFFHRFDAVRTKADCRQVEPQLALLLSPARVANRFSRLYGSTPSYADDCAAKFPGLPPVRIASFAAPPLDPALPIVFAVLAIIVSDIATHDERAGTTVSLCAAPRLRQNFVWWKLASTFVFALVFCAAPLL